MPEYDSEFLSSFQNHGVTNRSMIPGAIDENALLHVHASSYLTRWFRKRVHGAHRLSAFSPCVLHPHSRSCLSSLPLSVAAAVIAIVVVVAVAALSLPLSYSRQSHRAHVPRNRTAFSSAIWCTMRGTFIPLTAIEDRRFRS